jgi:hypothetical protein
LAQLYAFWKKINKVIFFIGNVIKGIFLQIKKNYQKQKILKFLTKNVQDLGKQKTSQGLAMFNQNEEEERDAFLCELFDLQPLFEKETTRSSR